MNHEEFCRRMNEFTEARWDRQVELLRNLENHEPVLYTIRRAGLHGRIHEESIIRTQLFAMALRVKQLEERLFMAELQRPVVFHVHGGVIRSED